MRFVLALQLWVGEGDWQKIIRGGKGIVMMAGIYTKEPAIFCKAFDFPVVHT
jgi:hypothetical protein